MEEEDEEMKEDRELAEVNEQVWVFGLRTGISVNASVWLVTTHSNPRACFERAERLRERQEMLTVQKDKKPRLEPVVGSGETRKIVIKQEEELLLDDVDFDDLLNWRSKMSL